MYGTFFHPHLQFQGVNVGLRTQFGALIAPPGANVHYVRSTGAADYDPPELTGRLHTTLNSALGQCRSGRCDYVYLLPGHTETISTADQMSSLVAGTQIVGVGYGDSRPVLNWTASGSTFLLDVDGVTIQNCILHLAGSPGASTALTVAAPITVSGAGCAIIGCKINTGVDANQLITVGITVSAGGNFFNFSGNYCSNWSTQTTASAAEAPAAVIGNTGTFLRLTGADGCVVSDNFLCAALTTVTDGVIEATTTASTNVAIFNNYIKANGALDTCAVDFGTQLAHTGYMRDNLMQVPVDATAETVVYTRHADVEIALLDNFLVNNKGERGLVIGTASA